MEPKDNTQRNPEDSRVGWLLLVESAEGIGELRRRLENPTTTLLAALSPGLGASFQSIVDALPKNKDQR
jgi:hypothetical protein